DELIAYFKNTYIETQKYESEALFAFDKSIYYYARSNNKPRALIEYLLTLTDDPRFQDQFSASVLSKGLYDLPTHRRYSSEDIGMVATALCPKEVQKCIVAAMLAEGLNSGDKGRVLSEKGFHHLPILARSAMITHLFTSYKRALHLPTITSNCSPQDRIPIIGVPLDCSLTIGCSLSDGMGWRSKSLDSFDLHPVLRKDQKALLERQWIKRDKSVDASKQEAEVSAKVEAHPNSGVYLDQTDAIAFLRASCEPSLFPHKLLSYFRGKLDLFESFQEQTLFEHALFRSVALTPILLEVEDLPAPYQRIRFFPLADEMLQKGFQDQAKLFIQEGIDRFFFRQPNQKPKVLAATLFIRLACRLSAFIDGTPLIDSLELIEKMMAVPSITQEERSLLSVHLVLAYSAFKRELTKEEIEKVFGAWVYYKNTPLPEEWCNPLLEREAATLIHRASAFLSENQDATFQHSILKTAILQLGIELPSSFTVSAKEPHLIEGKGSGADFWSVNILSGEVLSTDGILRRTKAPSDLQDGTFRYIFGEINPSYFETQGCYYFSHPKLGTFRALKTDNNRNTFRIQKLVGSQWYQYISPEAYLMSIPRFLCGNNTHWINIDSYSSDMIINERDTGHLVATINQGGIIESKDETERYWSVANNTFFTEFERPEYIHWSVNKSDKKRRLTFCRYQSHANHPLSFEVEGNELVFTENRNYFLSKEQKPGLLGATNGSLVLVHRKTGAEKVIVASKPLIGHTPLSTQHVIDVRDHDVTYSSL
ncbi:MAG TPA: hypothetical protein VIH61_07990, partial [Waddliaceae bacterium]